MGPRRLHLTVPAGSAVLFALLAAPVSAQTVELRVVEEGSFAAIAGAIVRLLDNTRAVAQGLTSESGTLSLRAPRPGTFRIRIDRIGWTGLTTEPFTLDSAQTLRLRVPMASRQMQLPTLEVSAKSRCEAKAQGGILAAALWEETEKALTANLITEAAKATPLHVKEFVREVSLEEKPLREWTVVSRIIRGAAFRSLPPADLVNGGFIQQVGDSAEFAAPDAALLLSDEFVATHCFRAVPGRNGLVGLAFEPMPRRKVPEVTGTLWVDRATSELKVLEYTYTRLPGVLSQARLGGRVAFTRLPGGRWIVNDWHIRMPLVATTQEYGRNDWREITRLSGYLERGGRAVLALGPRGRVDRAIVRGRVFDSIAGRGLAGAYVKVQGTGDSIVTDHDGRFELAVQASGDQIVAVRHRKLEVAPGAARKTALLSLDDTTVVNFGIPPIQTFVDRFCRNRNPPGTMAIVGTAIRVDGSPATTMGVFWVSRSGRSRPVHPDVTGLYGMCSVPTRDTIEVVLGDGNINLTSIRVPPSQHSRWLELRELGSTDTVAARFPSDSALTASAQQSVSYQYGAGRIGGTVRLERREFRWQNLCPTEPR